MARTPKKPLKLRWCGPQKKHFVCSENQYRCPKPRIARIWALHRHAQKKALRELVGLHAKAGYVPAPPLVVTVTRISPRKLRDEHDNLPASLKHVVDAIAAAIGLDDGDVNMVKWEHGQRTEGPGWYGVEIDIAADTSGGHHASQ